MRQEERGFTLLEVLVALVIAATAAAVISTFLRGLLARVEKEQAHQLGALRLLNQAALFGASSLRDSRWVYEGDTVLRLNFQEPELPAVKVENFLPNVNTSGNINLPPINLAFTPYQRFSVSQDRYSITFLRPSLTSPARGSQSADISTTSFNVASPSPVTAPEPAPVALTPPVTGATETSSRPSPGIAEPTAAPPDSPGATASTSAAEAPTTSQTSP